jgi:hypothetical protein
MRDTQPYAKFSYDAHARTCAPDDFLGQTRRTVQGVPIPEAQIRMILDAVQDGLQLHTDDVLLELACGNGALSVQLYDACQGYLGTDISEYLISVAKQHFERLPDYRFEMQGGVECVHQTPRPERFTRALCYAGFQYFIDADAADILATLHQRFTHLQRIFIGNLPDRARAADFYTNREVSAAELSDPGTALGTWRTREVFAQLAHDAGWQTAFSVMPQGFYAAHYRYDAVLTRKD